MVGKLEVVAVVAVEDLHAVAADDQGVARAGVDESEYLLSAGDLRRAPERAEVERVSGGGIDQRALPEAEQEVIAVDREMRRPVVRVARGQFHVGRAVPLEGLADAVDAEHLLGRRLAAEVVVAELVAPAGGKRVFAVSVPSATATVVSVPEMDC